MITLRNFISDTVNSMQTDSLSKLYNNIWGSYTNTHMRRLPNDIGWEITGHSIRYKDFFYEFLTSKSVPESPFINLPECWSDILVKNNVCAWFDKDASGFDIVMMKPCCEECEECVPGVERPQ